MARPNCRPSTFCVSAMREIATLDGVRSERSTGEQQHLDRARDRNQAAEAWA
jgi:hypothetical protein